MGAGGAEFGQHEGFGAEGDADGGGTAKAAGRVHGCETGVAAAGGVEVSS